MAVGTYRTWTEPFLTRWTPEQRERINAAAKFAGKKITDFIRDAVMARVDEVDEKRAEQKTRREEARRKHPFALRQAKPVGLGLRRQPVEPDRPPPAEWTVPETSKPSDPPPPTVVVHNHTAERESAADRLAAFVLAATNTVDRQERERQVLKALHESKAPQSEIESLARALDEKIEKSEPAKKWGSTVSSWLLSKVPR